MKTKKQKPKKYLAKSLVNNSAVDFIDNRKDLTVAIMGSLGFSDRYIESETGFTPGQINYRLALAGISRRAYRNGETPFAKLTVSSMSHQSGEHLARVLSKIRGEHILFNGSKLVLRDKLNRK